MDRSILIVDANPGLATMLQQALSSVGFDCTLALTGREAYQSASGKPVDLAIVDFHLPDGPAADLIRVLQKLHPGIILLARYVEERRRGLLPRPAMDTAVRGTLVPTLVASAAAALSYAALMTTTFRGYSHFGFMGSIGMVLCWILTYVLAPPVAVLVEQRWPLRAVPGKTGRIDRVFAAILAVTVMSAALFALVSFIERLVIPWNRISDK